MKHLIKLILIFILKIVAKSKQLSKLTTSIVSLISKSLPDASWKPYVYGLMNSIEWGHIEFKPQKVQVANNTSITLVPHLHEFDYTTLFWQNMPYEEELYFWIKDKIKDYDLIIDIGANVGIFSIFSAKANPAAQVYSFEPSTEAFYRLTQNKRNNKLPNLTLFNVAVAADNDFLEFFEPEGHLTNGSLDISFAMIFDKTPIKRKVIGVNNEFIEKLLATSTKKVLIKIDVEGAETIVLRNLQNSISKYKPDMIIEVLPSYEKQLNDLEFIKLHYSLFGIEKDGLVARSTFVSNTVYRDYFLSSK
jgi:FkbM family methyltransferase